MADALKHAFDAAVVRSIARDVKRAWPVFATRAFERDALAGLDDLELLDRGRHVAKALRTHLPQDFPQAADVLVRSLGPLLDATEGHGMTPFRYLPWSVFVAEHGLEHLEPALHLQYELTQRFTAEFCLRPYLERHPTATLARLAEWTRDPSAHVRRLVSEGTRPRLPWAPRLPAFQRDPAPVLALLEQLKDDPELYVRRSVANNLNDIGKDHPDLLVETCRRWWRGGSDDRRWIVRHALRSLVKQGHRGALAVIGFDAAPVVRVEQVKLTPARPKIGGSLAFACVVVSDAPAPQSLLVDWRVHFRKANGSSSPKTFKLRRVALEAGGSESVTGSVTLEQLSTRRHYPGVHRVELVVNGVVYGLGEVVVRA